MGDCLLKLPIKGSALISIHLEPKTRMQELTEEIGIALHNMHGSVSTSMALDLITRWFTQHPPSYEWMNAYVDKWLFAHPRGAKAKYLSDKPEDNYINIIEAGFKSVEEFREFVAKNELKKLRAMREVMEERDLNREEICPEVQEEWVKDGTLRIPKKVREIMGRLPPHEAT
jgi:hypothetical protein